MDRNILFLCTGNSARSQMAEGLLRKRAGSHFRAFSAGTRPAAEVFPPVVKVMAEIGLDISGQKPKGAERFLGAVYFEAVVVVCADAEKECPSIFGPAKRLFWPFEDPAAVSGSEEGVLAVCRRVRDQIDMKIRDWLEGQGIVPE